MNGNKIALCPWLIWSDSNATHLLLFISTICAITHHSSPMCFYSLFVPAVQGCTCIGSASFFLNQMFKSKCKKNANASILTYVCRLNVQIQMQKKKCTHSDLCLRIKCSNPNAKKRYASNLCLQIKCSNAADQGVHILHRALHQAIISFSNLIKLKTLWSKTFVVIIASVFKVGWKVRCWKVCSITKFVQ